MGLDINNVEAQHIAATLANITGHAIEDEILTALRERAERLAVTVPKPAIDKAAMMRAIHEIQERVAKLPILDPRTPEEILYDEYGLPK